MLHVTTETLIMNDMGQQQIEQISIVIIPDITIILGATQKTIPVTTMKAHLGKY